MEFHPIGHVHSSHVEQSGTPIQPRYGAPGSKTTVEVYSPYRDALADLDGFGRVWLITHLDRAKAFRTRVVPYRDTVERGLFATRAPSRPNPIGLSCVELLAIDLAEGVITLGAADLLDGTPVLDIKPYIAGIDAFPDARAGWFGASREVRDKADDRFA